MISFASNYVTHGGNGLVSNWFHPVFRGILAYISAFIFGNNPSGWRVLNVIAGTTSILLVWLISKELFRKREIALFASAFIAVDPLFLGWSRLALEEVTAAFFLLLSILFILKYTKNRLALYLLLSSVSLGLAISLKWYFLPLVPIFIIFVFLTRKNRLAALFFFIIPAIIYLLTFFPHFAKGYDLKDWTTLQKDMLQANLSLTREDLGDILGQPSKALNWFVAPTYLRFYFYQKNQIFRSILWLSNPLIWMLVLPSISYLLYISLKKKEWNRLFIAIIFISIYLPLVVASRPIFLYSAVPLLPLAFISVSYLLSNLKSKYQNANLGIIAYIAGSIGFSLFLYPLTTYARLPLYLYAPVLKLFGAM